MSEVNERTQRTSLLRGPVTDIPGLTTYLAATYLPLSGGTISGELFIASGGGLYLYDPSTEADVQLSVDDGELLVGGVTLLDNNSTLDASKLGVGTVPDARLSANVARRDQANTFSAIVTASSGIATSNIWGTGSPVGGVAVRTSQAATSFVECLGSVVLVCDSGNYTAAVNRSNVKGFATTSDGGFYFGPSTTNANGFGANGSIRLNATGPTLETRAAGGLKVCTADGSALAAVQCGNINASGVAKFTGYPTGLLPAAASNAGSITYDTTLAKHVGCDGTNWNSLW